MIFLRRRIGKNVVGDATIRYRVVTHLHRHRHHRCHRLDSRDVDLGKLLDEREDGVELAGKRLYLIVGDRDARSTPIACMKAATSSANNSIE